MTHFRYQEGQLHCEDVSISEIARLVGTPVFVYSQQAIIEQIDFYQSCLAGVPHQICYALKANSSLALMHIMSNHGIGADIVSQGELYLAGEAGMDMSRIVYSGVGKTDNEIENALAAGIMQFNVESAAELTVINTVAGNMGLKAPIAVRVNPDVDPKTHPYIATGLSNSKFGVSMADAADLYRQAEQMKYIEITGISMHIGSQLTDMSPMVEAAGKLFGLLKDLNLQVKYFDIGGGLGICYDDEKIPDYAAMIAKIKAPLIAAGCTLIVEPGRSMVGEAGVFVTKVLYRKENNDKKFVVIDGAMNDLMRPSLYQAYHGVKNVAESQNAAPQVVDIVGPICESGDFLAKDRLLGADTDRGDLLAFYSSGAYGFSMSSNYNSRQRAAEVLVTGGDFRVIRKRELCQWLIADQQL